MLITIIYALFILASDPKTSLFYWLSAILLAYSSTQLSYFCCFLLITLDITRILQLLSDLAIRFQNDQLASHFDADSLHRMAVFVFCTNCIYFNFAAYR
jgi:hypothetical protein